MDGKKAFNLFHWAVEVTSQPRLAAGNIAFRAESHGIRLSPVALWPSLVLLLNPPSAEPIDQLSSGCAAAVTQHYRTCPPRSPRQSHVCLARFAGLSNGQPRPHLLRGADR